MISLTAMTGIVAARNDFTDRNDRYCSSTLLTAMTALTAMTGHCSSMQ